MSLSKLCLVLAAVSLGCVVNAQNLPNQMTPATSTGALPYSTHEIVREDVSLATGDLHVYIPLLSLQGKGGQTLNLGWAYDSRPISLLELDNSNGWNDAQGTLYPYNYAVWQVSPDARGYITYPHLRASWLFEGDYPDDHCGAGGNSLCANYPLFCNANFVFRDEYGTNHSFYVSRDCSYTGYTNQQIIHTMKVKDVDDGSAMRLDASNPNDIIVRTKDGTAYHFPPVTTFPPNQTTSGSSNLLYYDHDFLKIVDPNGNTISNVGNTITDSVGRTITGLSWKDSNGQTQTVSGGPGGPVGPTVATDSSICSFNNPYQSNSQSVSSILGAGDLRNAPNLASSSTLVLPGGATYGFQFDSLGELTEILYPGGGYTRYDYQTFYPQMKFAYLTCSFDLRQVAAKHVCSSTSGSCAPSQEETTTYTATFNGYLEGANTKMDVRDPIGHRTQYVFGLLNLSNGSPRNPRETDRYIYQYESTLLKTIHTDYTSDGRTCGGAAGADNAVPCKVTTTLNDITPSVSSVVTTTYDTVAQNNNYFTYDPPPLPLPQVIVDNPLETDEYGFSGTLVKKTVFTWKKGGNYDPATLHILNRPATKTVTDPASGIQSTTTNGYDTLGNMLTQGLGGTGITTLTTQYAYDAYGDVTLVKDPLLHQTQYGYTNPWFDTACAQGVDSSGHPSSVTNALNQITNYKYYSCTGRLATATDPNNLTTTSSYEAANRVASVQRPDGGTTTTTYVDTAPQSVTITTKVNSSLNRVTRELLDGLGRENQSQLVSDPQGTTFKDTTYDADERVATVSNPYRTGGVGPFIATFNGTTYEYDALGRKISEMNAETTSIITAYCGPNTLVTDPEGQWRRSRTDALGRLVEVDEPNAVGATVAASGCPGTGEPIWVTSYTNDLLGNLTNVLQNGSHPRTFTYDSLSRLVCASNPETATAACPASATSAFPSGTVTYTYNSDGTVATKKDARLITTTYAYDALRRTTGVTYSNSDPSLTFHYDESNCLNLTTCQNIGHRTSTTDGAGSEFWAYKVDLANLRDFHQNRRTTNNITKNTTYYLDLIGDVTRIIYPTGRIVNYSYDSAGRPKNASDSSNGITYATGWKTPPANTNCVASAVCYTSQGSVYAISVGQTSSFTGLNILETYDKLLQPFDITASSTAGTAMDIEYSRDAVHVYGIYNALNPKRSQVFTYDQVGRITSAGTTDTTTAATCWGNKYTYDAWANLLSQSAWTPTYNSCTESIMGGVTADGNNHISGLTYDTSGNTLTDGSNTYTWNGESQLKTAGGVTYSYDGDGRRAAKVGSKLYWYGSGGEILAETNAAGASINDYVYFGGKRVALVPATGTALYYAEDSLGSSRVMVQSTGTVCYDADFTPFGAERAITNTCTQNAYKFEGKERDAETQNDDFGAREYSWRMGRWLSSDWSAVPVAVPYANLTNPQTLNLYSMVGDDPESFADLDGHGEGQVMLDRFEEQCRQGGDCSPVKPLLLVAGAATAGIGAEMAGGSVLLRNLLGLALATSPRTVPIIADVIEGLTPGPAGSLTISSATRLTQQEISTGVRLATQTGKGLAESAHVGEEFVDAAGKTYDAMGGGKAFEHFGDGSKFFDSIVSHTNKSVDVVALDLKGASKGQVGAINDFVKTLTKAQQQKIRRIY